jgi:hypothetical protein
MAQLVQPCFQATASQKSRQRNEQFLRSRNDIASDHISDPVVLNSSLKDAVLLAEVVMPGTLSFCRHIVEEQRGCVLRGAQSDAGIEAALI